MTSSPAVWARSAFAVGYAEDGTCPVSDRTARECIAVQEAAVAFPGPRLMSTVAEAGRAEGRRTKRHASHKGLYDRHSEELAALLAAILARLDHKKVATDLVDLAVQQASFGATPVERRKIVASSARTAILFHTTSDDRKAMNDANADGYVHAYAHGTAEAQATPSKGGPPDPTLVAAAAAAALASVPTAAATQSALDWTGAELDTTAMGAALAAGDGAGLSDAVKKVAQSLSDTSRGVKTYSDLLHRTVMQSYLNQIQRDHPERLVDFITMEDGDVCPICIEIEGENPWDPESVETPPVHFSCRCHLEMASEGASLAAF